MKRLPWVLTLALLLEMAAAGLSPGGRGCARAGEDARLRQKREDMVKTQVSAPRDYRRAVRDKRVLEAMAAVPRHLFVKPGDVSAAYGDHPLSIGHGQTISQPYIVALMTEMLAVDPEHRVLEIGTGSGYQAAVLSLLVKEVYSVEIVEPLAAEARARLKEMGYANVRVKAADGFYGWEEQAPFDRIIVTCAAASVPPALIAQLRPGGKLCLPLGEPHAVQHLTLVEKSPEGEITLRRMLPVRFVPFTRERR